MWNDCSTITNCDKCFLDEGFVECAECNRGYIVNRVFDTCDRAISCDGDCESCVNNECAKCNNGFILHDNVCD